MKRATAVGLGFVLTSLATFVVRQWPRQHALGWFELAGRPVAVDGQPVEDWRHANERLARSAAEIHPVIEKYRKVDNPPIEVLDREFTIDYVPAGAADRQRVTVRRFMPTRLLWGGSHHPIAYARYEVGGHRPLGQ